MHARIQIYWFRSSIFRHLKLELLTQFPASNDEKYINVVYIWRKFVSFYGYVHWRMTTEISVMYGSEKVNQESAGSSQLDRWRCLHIYFIICPKVCMICTGVILTFRVEKLRTETKIYIEVPNAPLKLFRKFSDFPGGGRHLICIFPRWPPPKRPGP